MELLELAVEDIVTLAATCRALGGDRVAPALGERLPKGLRSELTVTDMWNIVNFLRSIGPKP